MKVRNVPTNSGKDEFELPPLNGWDPGKDRIKRERLADERSRAEPHQSAAMAKSSSENASASSRGSLSPISAPKDSSPKKSLLHQEVHITLNAGKLVKVLFFIALFSLVFYAGRLSVLGFGAESVSGSATVAVAAEEPDDELAAEETAPAEETTTSPTDAEEEDAPAEQPADAADETIVTSYSSIGLAINKVKTEWKETYGRIIELDYTVMNREDGTIKPAYFMMTVEGYDFEKKLLLAKNSQSISAKSKLTTQLRLPSPGYTYSSEVSGDLHDVTILLSLYDASGALMASYSGAHDLSG